MLLQKSKSTFPIWGNVFGNLMNDPESWPHNFEHTFRTSPAVNIKEDENSFSIEMAAPGKKKEDFKVDVTRNVLTISSEKKEEKEETSEKFTRKEYSYEAFKRSFTLPEIAKDNEISATYTDGILTVNIPKKELKNKVKTITVS